MNQIDTINIVNLNSSSLHATTLTSDSSETNYFDATDALFRKKVSLGSHTFDAEQLGQLLSYLLAQHPEISI